MVSVGVLMTRPFRVSRSDARVVARGDQQNHVDRPAVKWVSRPPLVTSVMIAVEIAAGPDPKEAFAGGRRHVRGIE